MSFNRIQKQTVGLDFSDLCEFLQGNRTFMVHKGILESLSKLQQDAHQAGFDLAIASAHRDFSRQLTIWNNKASGKRDLLDSQGNVLPFNQLSETEKLYAILRWSAIPGASRHHWGTDIDIFDARQMSYEDVQLIPQEVENSGPCAIPRASLAAYFIPTTVTSSRRT